MTARSEWFERFFSGRSLKTASASSRRSIPPPNLLAPALVVR